MKIKSTKEKLKIYHHNYYIKNRERLRRVQKEYINLHREEKRAYDKIYNAKNKAKKLKQSTEYNRKHRDQINKRRKEQGWKESFYKARGRCTNPKDNAYKNYGKRGIKFLMTVEDFKFLWFRDKAYLMKRPSIDRIDNDGNYELSNCRYIEQSENTRKSHQERKVCPICRKHWYSQIRT